MRDLARFVAIYCDLRCLQPFAVSNLELADKYKNRHISLFFPFLRQIGLLLGGTRISPDSMSAVPAYQEVKDRLVNTTPAIVPSKFVSD